MSSKKKNAITMIALVVVLIICLVLYFVIPRGKSSDKVRQVNRTQRIPVRTMQKSHWIPLRLITFLRLP